MKEAHESEKPVSERMRFATIYRTYREMPLQEAVPIALPEIWLHKPTLVLRFLKAAYEKRYKICCREEEKPSMPTQSKDQFRRI